MLDPPLNGTGQLRIGGIRVALVKCEIIVRVNDDGTKDIHGIDIQANEKIAATLRQATGQISLEVKSSSGQPVWAKLKIEGEAQAPTVSYKVLNFSDF